LNYSFGAYSNYHPADISARKGDRSWLWHSTRSPYSFPLYFSHCFNTDQAAKDVSTSYDALVDLFECLGNYLRRLGIFTQIPSEMEGILVNIMVELLGVLALATRQVKQGRFSDSVSSIIHSSGLIFAQRNSRRSCWARTKSRRCFSVWTDSPWRSPG
jgi:hypothetical protein